jgi:peptide chain release factor subunit 1
MISEKELQTLVDFQGTERALSVYLNTDLAHHPKEAIKLMFRQCIKDLGATPAARDIAAVESFLDVGYDWQARGLAVFVSGEELWQVIPLPIAVRTQAYYTQTPYVRVLSDVVDRFDEYCVALVDKESVRLFHMAWGSVMAATEATGEQVKHHRQGGPAAARLQRQTENRVLQNLKQAVEMIQSFMQETGSKRLVLAGSSEAVAQLKELLPKHVRFQLAGEFAADMEALPSEILHESMSVIMQADLERERALVSLAITAAAKGGAGVMGLADTLYALREGRVRQLLVAEDYYAPGFACQTCGYVAVEQAATCMFCGSESWEPVPDAVNWAIQQAVQGGAEVNVVRGNSELAQVGHIAATLRY